LHGVGGACHFENSSHRRSLFSPLASKMHTHIKEQSR
jgi:hypothetical protein